MNKKEEQELEELYADLKEEARLNDKRRKKYDRIVIEQMMKVCSKEEVLKILGELENKKITEIRELLNQILNKLETTELKIEKQVEEINKYIQQHGADSESGNLLIAQGKSTKTSIELLREEIEELHQVVKFIFQQTPLDQCSSVEIPTSRDHLRDQGDKRSNLTKKEGSDGIEE